MASLLQSAAERLQRLALYKNEILQTENEIPALESAVCKGIDEVAEEIFERSTADFKAAISSIQGDVLQDATLDEKSAKFFQKPKITWDLERNIADLLEELQAKTDECLLKILKEQINENKTT